MWNHFVVRLKLIQYGMSILIKKIKSVGSESSMPRFVGHSSSDGLCDPEQLP